jgi:signal peptidase II
LKKLSKSFYLIYSAIILGGIIIDQLTKLLAVKLLAPLDTVPIIKGALHLTYVENRGAAFGMLANHRWVFMILSTVSIIALGILLFSGYLKGKLYTVSVAMIISGGIGNMIDRIFLGYVVDFIDFRLINFAVFNGADSFVCVGAGLLLLAALLDTINESRSKRSKGK